MVTDNCDRASPFARRALALAETLSASLQQDGRLNIAAREIACRLRRGGILYAIGNGGAAALAEHLTAELLGRLSADRERPSLAAASLCSDAVLLSAIAERSGFAECFAYQLRIIGRPEDVLVIFTTSGRSANLAAAMHAAAALGMYRLAFSGLPGSKMDQCETVIHAPSGNPGTVQECHLVMLHALAESIEDAMADFALHREGTPDDRGDVGCRSRPYPGETTDDNRVDLGGQRLPGVAAELRELLLGSVGGKIADKADMDGLAGSCQWNQI
jgi:D-sedoheptulose 7-phosphate isomerase